MIVRKHRICWSFMYLMLTFKFFCIQLILLLSKASEKKKAEGSGDSV